MSVPAPDPDMQLTFIGSAVVASVVFNFIFGRGVGDVSCTYPAKFLPSSGAFGIWGPIYVFAILTIAEQMHSRSSNTGNYETPISNVCYALAWALAALWTSAFTLTTKRGGKEVPHPTGLLVAAVFLTLSAASSMVAVFNSTAWNRSSKGSLRWISGVAFGMLSGWLTVAATVNIAIAYNANDNVPDTPCDPEDDKYTILDKADPQYETYVPLTLSFAMCLVAVALPNPIVLLPVIWALFWMRPSYLNYISMALMLVVELIALFRTFL